MKSRLLFLFAAQVSALGASEFAGQHAGTEAKALIAKAEELAKARDLDGAVSFLEKAVQGAPDNDLLFGALSDFEFKAGKFALGLKHARKAIALQPAKGAYYCLAAVNAYGEQDVAKCREYCKVVLDQPQKFGPGPVLQARFLEDLLLEKTFTFFFKLDPRKGRLVGGSFALGLPKTGLPYQKTSYEISGVRSHRLARGQSDDILHVMPQGTEPFPLTINVTVKPHSFKQALAKASQRSLPPEARANLGPILSIDPKSPLLKKVVSGLKGKDTVESVRNIQAWMSKNIEYKLQIASFREVDFKSVDEIVKRGYAECQGYAMLFTGLCRAAGIPARPVWGLMRVPPGVERKFGEIVSHNWAEVYVPGSGWVPVDPQRFETLGFLPNHYVRMFTGSQRSAASTEAYPLFNLLSMHDAKIRFEERAESQGSR
jgi:tetratricopeptide (TPR) repeat protein